MLQTLRTKAAGVVAKLLFALLIASFAVWGIGDYAFLRQGEQTAIQVGGNAMTATTLGNEYRRELDGLRRSLGPIDPDMARQIGLIDRVAERLVAQMALDEAIQRLGIRIGDDQVRMRITADPAFQGPGGFDRSQFLTVIRDAGYNEAQFIDVVRRDLGRAVLASVFDGAARAPSALAEQLYRYRNERRSAESVFVPAAGFTELGEPGAEELQAIYDDNTQRFTVPEYRALTVIRVAAQDIKSQVEVTEEQVREEFESRRGELTVPERREVEQMLFSDEEAAKSARAKLTEGASFLDVAAQLGQPADRAKLGVVQKDDLPPELGAAAFAVENGATSEPVRTAFGWHLVHVARVEPGHEPTFEEVRERLKEVLAERIAADRMYDVAIKVEDAVVAGTPLETVAAEAGVPAVKIAAIDLRGRTPDGTADPFLNGVSELLNSAFDTPQGRETPLVEARRGGFFVARVDGITPQRVKPLDEVRAEVVALWQQDKRQELARQRAETIAERATKGGKSLAEAAEEFDLKPQVTAGVRRTGAADPGAPPVPQEVVGRIFQMKSADEVAVVGGAAGYYAVKLAGVTPANPAGDSAGVDAVARDVSQQLANDMFVGYTEALKQRFGVTIDKRVLEQVQ